MSGLVARLGIGHASRANVERQVFQLQRRFRRNSIAVSKGKKKGQRLVVPKKMPSVNNTITISEAARFCTLLSRDTFDETVELNVNLNLDSRKPDMLIRGNIMLPEGIGEDVTVCAFVPEGEEEKAREAGADLIGSDDMIAQIMEGIIKFDKCVAHPAAMKNLSKCARVLGPKGLMPSPKFKTMTPDYVTAIKDMKKGQISVRTNPMGMLNCKIGKCSMGPEKIENNVAAVIKALRDELRPSGARQKYFIGAHMATTQGRGMKLALTKDEPWVKKKSMFD